MHQSASFFSWWVTVTEVHSKQHKDKDNDFHSLFISSADLSCADLTLKVNSCEQFKSLICPVIVTHACSFYGSTRSCNFSTGDATCLISETYICDGRSGIKVSLLWHKTTKKIKKTQWDQESIDICGDGTVLLGVLLIRPPNSLRFIPVVTA